MARITADNTYTTILPAERVKIRKSRMQAESRANISVKTVRTWSTYSSSARSMSRSGRRQST